MIQDRVTVAADKPALLFLAHNLPFPPDGGVKIRTFHTLRLLARHFRVTSLFLSRPRTQPKEVPEAAAATELARFGRVHVHPVPQETSRPRLLLDHARSLFTGRAYTYYAYYSASFERVLTSLLRTETFDLAHVDSIDLHRYFPALNGLPVVCAHHNVESDLLVRRSQFERGWRRTYLRRQSQRIEQLERRWAPRCALNVTASDRDGDALRRIAPGARFVTIPNGVDARTFAPGSAPSGAEPSIVFVGGTTWFPNKDALTFFTTAILPALPSPRPKVVWVGRATEQERASFKQAGVHMTGYVEDVRPFVHAASCYIVPMRAGGGTRLKILDAWSMGKPVVSTSIGCEGLQAVDGENILVRDAPQDFAQAVAAVLSDRGLAARLGAAARRTVEQVYDWDVLDGQMAPLYFDLVKARPR